MPTRTSPEYKATLRSRGDICAWLLSPGRGWSQRGGVNYDGQDWLFCFNVKLTTLDLSFERLLDRYVTSGYVPPEVARDRPWVDGCASVYHNRFDNDQGRNDLYEWSTDLARAAFVGDPFGAPTDTQWRQLRDGTPVKAHFSFFGHGGGWLTLRDFEGETLTRDSPCAQAMQREVACDSEVGSDRVDLAWLRKLYHYVSQLQHALEGDAVKTEVEYTAAAIFFDNFCGDVRSETWLRALQAVRRQQEAAFINQLLGLGPRRLGGSAHQADASDIVRPKRRIERIRRPHGQSENP